MSNSEFNETTTEEAHQLLHRVRHDILAQDCPEYLSYEFIEPEIGFQVALALDEDGSFESGRVRIDYNSLTKQLTVVLTSGFFTVDEFKHLELSAITRFTKFGPPFESSVLVPDLYLAPAGAPLPTVVLKAGLLTPYYILLNYKDGWLTGAPSVNVFILIKRDVIGNKYVRGRMEIWRKDMPDLELFCLFPNRSCGPSGETVANRQDKLYGGWMGSGRNAADIILLHVDRLRHVAVKAMEREGYRPALE